VKKNRKVLAWFMAFMLATAAAGRAQEKPEMTPLKVDVVISKWQGEKKISSMPYILTVNAPPSTDPNRAGRANLRMGAKIPIVMFTAPPVPGPDGKEMQAGPIQYQDVGTNIDCTARVLDVGRYAIDVTIDDTSVYEESGKRGDRPSFRSFRASDQMILKDGQTAQFTAATDKVNGEVTRVDVTLRVAK
jgi:hypothetical protein